MTRERYFSPGTAPFERFARGVYDALPKSFDEANKMFNPVEVLQEASGKSRRFFESGGRDRQAGIEALIDTAMLGVGPAAYGVASLLRTPAKKSVDYATKAFQELFNPLGASDDKAVETGTKGMTRRDFLGGTGAAVTLAGAPILKEVGDLLPSGKIAKATPVKSLLEASDFLFKQLEELGTQIKKERNIDFDRFGQVGGVRSEGGKVSSGDGSIKNFDDLFKLTEDSSKVKMLEGEQLDAAKKMNALLSEFTEGLTKKDLMALSDADLIALNKIKHYNPVFSSVGAKAGDPLRKQYKKTADGETVVVNAEIDELIDEVLKERDLYDPFFMFKEFAEGGVISLKDKAVNMTKNPKGVDSLIKTATDMYK